MKQVPCPRFPAYKFSASIVEKVRFCRFRETPIYDLYLNPELNPNRGSDFWVAEIHTALLPV